MSRLIERERLPPFFTRLDRIFGRRCFSRRAVFTLSARRRTLAVSQSKTDRVEPDSTAFRFSDR